jgi:uncharacterized protein involved in exopolysaccharide biosynthesis
MAEHTAIDTDEVSLLELLQIALEQWRLLVVGPLVTGLFTLAVCFVITPTFTASTQFLPPQQQQSSAAAMLQSLGALGGLAGAATGLKNPADQYIALLKSRAVQDAVIAKFDLQNRYDETYLEDTRKELTGNVTITSGKDGLITLESSDTDPAVAANIANAHVQELRNLLGRLALTEAQQRRVFFEEQLNQTKVKLIAAERALKSSGLNISAIKASPQAAVDGLARLKAAVTAQEIRISSMRGYLADTAPDFKQAQNELSAMRAQLNQSELAEPSASSDTDYVARFRDFKYFETLFELFAKQYEIARVDESREGAVIQVVDVATPPEKKSKPRRALTTVIATLASGFVLLLFVFARQAWNKR